MTQKQFLIRFTGAEELELYEFLRKESFETGLPMAEIMRQGLELYKKQTETPKKEDLKMKKLEIIPVTESLLCVYPGQSAPQKVFIELDPIAGTVQMDYNPETGNSVPADVFHRLRLRYELSAVPTVETANELMEDLLPQLQKVAEGHSEVYNGQKYVGALTEEAEALSKEIEYDLYQYDFEFEQLEGWDDENNS